jgi:hypothetical protein
MLHRHLLWVFLPIARDGSHLASNSLRKPKHGSLTVPEIISSRPAHYVRHFLESTPRPIDFVRVMYFSQHRAKAHQTVEQAPVSIANFLAPARPVLSPKVRHFRGFPAISAGLGAAEFLSHPLIFLAWGSPVVPTTNFLFSQRFWHHPRPDRLQILLRQQYVNSK